MSAVERATSQLTYWHYSPKEIKIKTQMSVSYDTKYGIQCHLLFGVPHLLLMYFFTK